MLKLEQITLIDDAGLVAAHFRISIENDDSETANTAELRVRLLTNPSATLNEIKILATDKARAFIADLAEF